MQTNFPDKQYLDKLAEHLEEQAQDKMSSFDKILVYSGVKLNWIADYILDENIEWDKTTLPINNLYLTGTGPEWNKIIIDKCERSPQKLSCLMKDSPEVKKLFSGVKFADIPILVRYEDNKYKVLDGMNRVISSIRDGRKNIEAYVAELKEVPKPTCELHVVYDLLKAYDRGINNNQADLIAALRFLNQSYPNVREYLDKMKNSPKDDKIKEIIEKVLAD